MMLTAISELAGLFDLKSKQAGEPMAAPKVDFKTGKPPPKDAPKEAATPQKENKDKKPEGPAAAKSPEASKPAGAPPPKPTFVSSFLCSIVLII